GVEANDLAVQVGIADDLECERGELIGRAETLREQHRLAERFALRVGERTEQGRIDESGRDRAHAYTGGGEVTSGGERERHAPPTRHLRSAHTRATARRPLRPRPRR